MENFTVNYITGNKSSTIGGKKIVSDNNSSSYLLTLKMVGDLSVIVNKNIQLLRDHLNTVREARELVQKGHVVELTKKKRNETTRK